MTMTATIVSYGMPLSLLAALMLSEATANIFTELRILRNGFWSFPLQIERLKARSRTLKSRSALGRKPTYQDANKPWNGIIRKSETSSSLLPALVAGIQPAQVLELKESFDPTDVGSLDPRHKGEDEGKWGIALAKQSQFILFSATGQIARAFGN